MLSIMLDASADIHWMAIIATASLADSSTFCISAMLMSATQFISPSACRAWKWDNSFKQWISTLYLRQCLQQLKNSELNIGPMSTRPAKKWIKHQAQCLQGLEKSELNIRLSVCRAWKRVNWTSGSVAAGPGKEWIKHQAQCLQGLERR